MYVTIVWTDRIPLVSYIHIRSKSIGNETLLATQLCSYVCTCVTGFEKTM